jgi:hypothetical protein
MTESTTLLEPSMLDVLKAIDAASDLSQTKKTHWSCSVRQICVGIGRPPESIPGRLSGVNAALQRLHHAHRSLLIRGHSVPAIRQKLHLSSCADFRDRL